MTTAHLVGWTDPDFAALRTSQQAELRARYGDDDIGHEMSGEDILDVVLLRDGAEAVACGALRDAPELGTGTGELKRLFVVPEHRGRRLAGRVVDELEALARARGLTRLVIETGVLQPDALGLYLGRGYAPIDRFPPYEDVPTSRCLAKDLTAAAIPEPGSSARARQSELPGSAESAGVGENGVGGNGVGGLVVDRLGWMDPAAVALRAEMAAFLRGLYGRVGWFADDETRAATDAAEADRALVVLVVRDGDTPVATVTLSKDPADRPAGWGELERLLVLPAARGRGVARLLLREVEAEARARGMSTLTLSTGYRQLPAIQLYLTSGYRIVAPVGDEWPRQDRLFWFAKEL